MMRVLPAHISSLDLSDNELGKKKGEELVAIVQALPANITILDLSFSELGERSEEELVAIMQAFPANIPFLDLSENKLCKISGEGLATILNTIPQSVTCIDIGGNDLRVSQIKEILCKNPEREFIGDDQLEKINEEYRLYVFKTFLAQGELISPDVANIIISYLSPLGENMSPLTEDDIAAGEVYKKLYAYYQKLYQLTKDYKEKSHGDKKNEILDSLFKALTIPESFHISVRIKEFKRVFHNEIIANKSLLTTHQDPACVRYVDNVRPILTTFSVDVRALTSYRQYGTFCFGQPANQKAKRAIDNTLEGDDQVSKRSKLAR